jgi:hypothetical protein
MNEFNPPSVVEMTAMIAAQRADLAEIETTLQHKFGAGTAEATAKRQVANALAQQALAILQRASVSVEYFNDNVAPESEESPPQTDDTGLLEDRVKMAAAVAASMAEALGVDAKAIPLFLVEGVMLRLVGDMISQVKELLAEADAAESMAG